jgi:hypothetical protein
MPMPIINKTGPINREMYIEVFIVPSLLPGHVGLMNAQGI